MRFLKILLLLSVCIMAVCCSKSNNQQGQIPYVVVSRTFSINDPNFRALNNSNGFVYLDGEGVKGILLVNFGGQIIAFERNCPYQSTTSSCAKVTVEKSAISIRCGSFDASKNWVPCCNSQWSLDGNLLQGPATYSLKRYNINFDPTSGFYTITN